MIRDRYGLALSTSSAAAGQAYVEGVDRFLAAHAAAEECFDRAVVADPGFAGDTEGLARWVALLREGLAQGRVPVGDVVPTVAEAMLAFAEGRYEDVIRGHAPVVDRRVGGSWAQRDLFEHTLFAAYLRAGRAAEARALLARRADRQPSVPVAGA